MMRYTVIEGRNGICFVAPQEALPQLVAACSHDPLTIEQFFLAVAQYAPTLRDHITAGLAVFDEHNLPGHVDHIHQALKAAGLKHPTPPFRILDEVTRQASLEPFKWGLVLFNVPSKRIVQIQNTYMPIRREGRVVVEGTTDRRRARTYRLPAYWRIVP